MIKFNSHLVGRILHKIWSSFWTLLLFCVIIFVIVAGIVLLMLQTQYGKSLAADQIENWFNNRYQGELSIGDLDGTLPFNAEAMQVVITHQQDGGNRDTVMHAETVELRPYWADMLTRRISIQDIRIYNPEFYLDFADSGFAKALQRQEEALIVSTFQIPQRSFYLPNISIQNGSATFTNVKSNHSDIELPGEFSIAELSAEAFFETENGSVFIDFDTFDASISGFPTESLSFSGQIFTDPNTIELNGINLQTGNTVAAFNAGISNFTSLADLTTDNEISVYRLNLRQGELALDEWTSIFPALERYPYPVEMSGRLEGPVHDFNLHNLRFKGHEANLRAAGNFQHLTEADNRQLDVQFSDLRFGSQEVDLIGENRFTDYFNDWDLLSSAGSFNLNSDRIDVSADVDFPDGNVNISAEAGLRDSTLVSDFEIDGFNSVNFPSLEIAPTRVTATGNLDIRGWDPRSMDGDFTLNLDESSYDHFAIREGDVNGKIADGSVETDYQWSLNSGSFTGSGTYHFDRDLHHLIIEGSSTELDLAQFREYWSEMPDSELNFDYEFNVEGNSFDQLFGFARLDIDESRVNQDTLRAHQLYLDLDSPDQENRNLRFTSSFLDIIIEGQFEPLSLYNQIGYWSAYIEDEVRQNLILEKSDTTSINRFSDRIGDESVEINGSVELKDLDLLRNYYNFNSDWVASSEMEFNINMNDENFLLNGSFQYDSLSVGNFTGSEFSGQIYAQLNQTESIRDFGDFEISVESENIEFNQQDLGPLSLQTYLANGFIETELDLNQLGGQTQLNSRFATQLEEEALSSQVLELAIHNPEYDWNLEEPSDFIYTAGGQLKVSDFRMVNEDQMVQVDGTFSSDENDSVAYNIQNLNLQRISELIDGRIPFEGTLDGEFITRTLFTSPFFDGNLTVANGAIDGRPVGDLNLTSNYNSEEQRFDTDLRIHTNEENYSDYLEGNEGVGQDIRINGYVLAPDWNNPSRDFFSFDAEFVELDLWVLEYIVDDIFEDAEGMGDGEGYLTGSLEDFDFNADFNISRSAVEPTFFQTLYDITGDITVNRHDGVTFHDLDVRDDYGGEGLLFGNVAFNDFTDEREIDLTLELDDLQFLDSSYDPEIPFYGSAYGTGVVTVTGTNQSPVVSTTETVVLSSNSRLSVPMALAGNVDDQRRFIQFVRDFSEASLVPRELDRAGVTGAIDRSFTETFTLDLDFSAPENINVELIFDRVTDEILRAEGSGQMRITLEDEDYGMMGRYDINSGNYRFVGGDIFTRQFSLREGGSIIWDGSPDNARLNIEALYRSRPNINALLEGADADMQAQRIPVDLVLEITGTIQEVENDFYFEFPNAIDATQNAAVLSVLNSEDQKLLQATALLLTGGFISVGQDGFTQAQQFTNTVQARAGEVGLSQLVSAQINELLNPTFANIDIDLNMMGFDQADLGIALRLFDDRLELRRDGQVTGEEADIGDLGATYRINPTLSVEVFHRKDPTLISAIGRQAQEESVNGVGLEAQVQFNTWQELGSRITGAFRSLFGLREDDDEEEDDPDEGLAEDS